MAMHWRLGLDVGSNSIGWTAYAVRPAAETLAEDDPHARWEPVTLLDLGVRIFSDGRRPKEKTSLAVDRRTARGARRRRDRYQARRAELLARLVELGLMPGDQEDAKRVAERDPYALRVRGLDHPLTPHELGRVLFHLNQRRGFKSNRRAGGDEKEEGKVKEGSALLRQRMAEPGVRTLGEYLNRRKRRGLGTRARTQQEAGREYRLYPLREMLEAEFDLLREKQTTHHPALDEAAWEGLRRIIFFQRPLQPVQPGWCEVFHDQPRAPWALPVAQRFRIQQDLAHLRVILPDWSERRLTDKERTEAAYLLERAKEIKFTSLAKKLGLAAACTFNLAGPKRDHLKGNATAALLGKKELLGERWHRLSEADQHRLVAFLQGMGEGDGEAQLAEDETEAAAWLTREFGLEGELAARVARLPLPAGHARLSEQAIRAVLPHLAAAPSYAEACRLAGWHHSDRRPDELLPELPYYGELLRGAVIGGDPNLDPAQFPERHFGKIANPSVHIALNQVRKLVNAAIARWGRPAQIVVESTRELKLGPRRMAEIEREQKKNQDRNTRVDRELAALGIANPSRMDRFKFRLWEELGDVERPCPFCGVNIPGAELVSDAVEIEHILPFSRSLDDSFLNLTVSHRRCNREKGKRTPHEAWGAGGNPRYDMEAILARVEGSRMVQTKQRRFGPGWRQILERIQGDFLARHLSDTAYVTRSAVGYLGHVCPQVWGVPGRLTAMLRGRWGLNTLLWEREAKDRTDHRHHAIDAAVVGVTDRRLLQRMSTANAREAELERIEIPRPWEGFREEVKERLARVVVSHKPDHGLTGGPLRGGTAGRLHEETAFGPVNPDATGKSRVEADGYCRVSVSKPLDENTFKKAEALEAIRDPGLARKLARFVAEEMARGVPWKQALAQCRQHFRIRSVRVVDRANPDTLVWVRNRRTGLFYKAYKGGGNHCMEICCTPQGKWKSETISTFDAHQEGFAPAWPRQHKGARLVMRLFKGDMVALQEGETRRVLRVDSIWTDGRLVMADHQEGGNLKAREKAKTFAYVRKVAETLRKAGARKVSVDVLGRVQDPGPEFWQARCRGAKP